MDQTKEKNGQAETISTDVLPRATARSLLNKPIVRCEVRDRVSHVLWSEVCSDTYVGE